MGVDLRQIRYLVAVVEAGTISKAATRLYVSQPALTMSLQKLEQAVGVPLLYRHHRGVELTRAGEAFVARAAMALEVVEDATATARRVGTLGGAALVIGLLPATLSALPRAVVQAFHSQHPEVRVRYRELSYINHTTDLATGRVDLAFLWPPYTNPDLRFLPLGQEPRMLGVAEADSLAGRGSVALDDILDRPFPGYHPASSGGWFAAWFFDEERGGAAGLTGDEAATPFEMGLIVREGRAVAPAAQSFALAFPVPGVRWLPITDAPLATLALSWYPANRNVTRDAFVAVAQTYIEIERGLMLPEREHGSPR